MRYVPLLVAVFSAAFELVSVNATPDADAFEPSSLLEPTVAALGTAPSGGLAWYADPHLAVLAVLVCLWALDGVFAVIERLRRYGILDEGEEPTGTDTPG